MTVKRIPGGYGSAWVCDNVRPGTVLDVEVWVLRQGCGPRIKVTAAEFTFVALDEAGRPRQVARRQELAATPDTAPESVAL